MIAILGFLLILMGIIHVFSGLMDEYTENGDLSFKGFLEFLLGVSILTMYFSFTKEVYTLTTIFIIICIVLTLCYRKIGYQKGA